VETSQIIQKEIFKTEHPINMPYNQVMIKGETIKMSSSKGNAFVIKDLLKVYTPEIIRFIYLGTKPNKEFSISFDEDVMKIYEDFYWTERIYFKKEDVNERSQNQWSRVYELSQTKKSNIPKKLPEQPKFGYCVEIINLCNHDIEKAWKKIKEFKKVKDKKRWISVLERASFWVKNYATDKHKVELLKKPPKIKIEKNQKKVIEILINDLKSKKWKEEELYGRIFDICRESEIKPGKLFSILYQLLIGRKYGPRLATFILAVGQEKIIKILEKI
jgi:lysyl-tRNA synthetase class 1